MNNELFEVESSKPFSESLIWSLNRHFYEKQGMNAWQSGAVPHQLTSSSYVGKTYASLIFAFLKDLANQGKTKEKVYILELGAGHGRLTFHILKHLNRLINRSEKTLPKYTYIISDIVEENLSFFLNHSQFQEYLESGQVDVAYFDAVKDKELHLRYSKQIISQNTLQQPIIALANYFFDSLPTDLFYCKDQSLFHCKLSLQSYRDPSNLDEADLLKNLKLTYFNEIVEVPFYEDHSYNDQLDFYRKSIEDAYVFFPHIGMNCIKNLCKLSSSGALFLSMDKGFHELVDIDHVKRPDMVTHGSMSFWVNYHAIAQHCIDYGGVPFLPTFSNFDVELACLFFSSDSSKFIQTINAYHQVVDEFGPDDFNSLKKSTYQKINSIGLRELLALIRLSAYDSTFFITILPRLKQLAKQISFNERKRIEQSLHQIWYMYFYIGESYDLAFEIGGLLYALGFYSKALVYFEHSIEQYGNTADVYYNKALCFYQLRQDDSFIDTLKEGQNAFPNFEKFKQLSELDLEA